LTDYTKRFKTVRDLLVSQLGGPIILTQYIDKMKVTNKSDKQEMRRNQESAFEKFLAYTYLQNSDKTKYGSLMNNLIGDKDHCKV
jgi:hypothetical protein